VFSAYAGMNRDRFNKVGACIVFSAYAGMNRE
jgi:hypothetical protein